MSVDASAGSAPGGARPVERVALEWAGALALGALLAALGIHALGVALDFVAAIRFPYQLDYGEGIVWHQATRIPGPEMYRSGQDLPFIVFHYPPVYYLLTRAIAWVAPDMLSAGRIVSALAALSIAPLVAALVLTAGRRHGERLQARHLAIAGVAGLLALCLHAVRTWGLVMRVDMVSIALGLAGVLLAVRANGRVLGTTLGLLLCLAAVYTKQTQLPAGVAVFAVVLIRRPRKALIAGAIALIVGLGALAVMQMATDGGFLRNIVGYNINRFRFRHVFNAVWPERSSAPFMVLMIIAAYVLLLGLWKQRAPGPRFAALGQLVLIVRLIDPTMAARAILLLHFGLASLALITLMKSGGNFNYLLDWLCVGTVLVGVLLCDLLRSSRRRFLIATGVLLVGVLAMPFRQMPDRAPLAELDRQTALVQRIAAAEKPVASEEMTLLMRAGKPILFEPSIVSELAEVGLWDERPLVNMIAARGFAFMITTDNELGGSARRTKGVDAALRAAYPRIERVGPKLWLHMPP